MKTHWRTTLVVLGGAFSCAAVFGLAARHGEPKPRLSPEAQAVMDRYESVQEEMTEAEVDAFFEGYESSKRDRQEEMTGAGKRLLRTSSFSKTYYKTGIEGDYFVMVYFDGNGRVVGKWVGESCR